MPILSRCLRFVDRQREPAMLWHEHAGAVHSNASGAAVLADRSCNETLLRAVGRARDEMRATETATAHGSFALVPLPFVAGGGVFVLAMPGTLARVPASVQRAFELNLGAAAWFEALEGPDADPIGFGRPPSAGPGYEYPSAGLLRATLPTRSQLLAGCSVDVAYRVGDERAFAATDWFEVFEIPGGMLALAVGDGVAKDLDAAAGARRVRRCLRESALRGDAAHDVLFAASRAAAARDDLTITSFFGVLDPLTREFTHANAAHPSPLVIEGDCAIRSLEGGRSPLGARDAGAYDLDATSLADARALALFTDGLTLYGNGVTGEERMRRILSEWARSGANASAAQLVDAVVGARDMRDDLALVVVRFERETNLTFTIEASVGAARRARYGVTRFMQQFDVSEERRFGFITALSEAINNAVEHGSQSRDDEVHVSLEFADDRIRSSIASSGAWRPHVSRIERGRGLTLMRALSSSVEIGTHDEGTCVRLDLDGVSLRPSP